MLNDLPKTAVESKLHSTLLELYPIHEILIPHSLPFQRKREKLRKIILS